MPRFHKIHTNFTAGEFSPLLYGRVDVSKYTNAAKTLKNVVILPQGGVERRGGWHYVEDTKVSYQAARLIPFEYSSIQAYILEFGSGYIRFYMNGYQIKVVTGSELMTNGSFASDISGWTDKSVSPGTIAWESGHMDLNGGASGVGWAQQSITTVSGKEYCLRCDVATNNLKVRIGTTDGGQEILSDTELTQGTFKQVVFKATSTTTYIGFRRDANGGADLDNVTCKEWIPYEIVSPYTESQLPDIRYAQNTNTLYLVHPEVTPRKLTRSANDNWTLSEITFIDGPYIDEDKVVTITPSGTTGNITLTASAALFNTDSPSKHIGAFWRIRHGTDDSPTWGYVVITAVTDSTHASATVKKTLGGSTASTAQREGSWSTLRGYPTSIGFYEDRCVFAGSPSQPQTFWGSKSGIYEDFTPGVEDDEAYYYTLGSGKMDIIRWLSPAKELLCGTAGSEYKITGGSSNPITPSNIDVKSEATYGSANCQPLRIGHTVLFLQKAGRKIRELAYHWESDTYTAPDMTLLAEHLVWDGIKEMAYQQEPYSIVWVIRNDGMLLGMTYERAQDIVGWHQHPTNGEVESIAVIPSPPLLEDQLWAIIKRTVNGQTKRFIEYMDYYNFTDCCLEYSGSAVTTVSGMDHLIGKTVSILGDGSVYPDAVVSESGTVTLDGPAANSIEVGLPFISTIELLRPEIPTGVGTSQGIKKHWSKIIVRLFETIGVTINGELIEFRTSDDEMDEGLDPYTGDVFKSNLGRDAEAIITIEQTQPLPLTVIAVIGIIDMGD